MMLTNGGARQSFLRVPLYGFILILFFVSSVAAAGTEVSRPCGVNSLGHGVIRGFAGALSECQVAHPVVSDAKVCVEPCMGMGNVTVVWEGWHGAPVSVPTANCSSTPSTAVHVDLGSESGGAGSVLLVWWDNVGKGAG